jgi:hypothetical protein
LLYPVELRAQTDESGDMLKSPPAVLKRHATHIAFPPPARKQMSAHCAHGGYGTIHSQRVASAIPFSQIEDLGMQVLGETLFRG